MTAFIRLGDKTDHGGVVITASENLSYDHIPLARKGDHIRCPKHPEVDPNVIEEGDPDITDEDGAPVAREGHRGTCGCRLISSIK
ncbi:PAAR domain-containing protein [Paraburkholderia oxyphila]|uniref:PAAR domain-containing protein n=1 Tax=Paraburkholderia oxyphila TaxID=614212 RepID=UPI000A079D5F|nr:PAAR domain-containing protein [Paraburkholderia oxyphila]